MSELFGSPENTKRDLSPFYSYSCAGTHKRWCKHGHKQCKRCGQPDPMDGCGPSEDAAIERDLCVTERQDKERENGYF